MAKMLCMDMRERIANAIRSKRESQPCIAERFGVSISTVEGISRKINAGESLEPAPRPGRTRSLSEKHLSFLRRQIEAHPFISSYELTQRYNKCFRANRVHRSTILRAMHELGFSFKKNSVRTPA